MVSHRQIKAKACTTDSCKKGPETMQRFYILWTVTLYRLCVLNREVLAWNSSFLWEVRLRWFVLRCCGHSHTTRLCAQHMSNTSPHSCPCIAIWLLNHYQSFLEALLSLSFFLSETYFKCFSLVLFHCILVTSCAFFPYPPNISLSLSSLSLTLLALGQTLSEDRCNVHEQDTWSHMTRSLHHLSSSCPCKSD